MLFAHQFVDLVVQVADHEVAEGGVLDLADFAGDLFEDLPTPFLTCWNRYDGSNGFGTSGAANI